MVKQCPSCGGFCGTPCQRDNTKALELACYFHNRCSELEEIIEMFCLDAEAARREIESMKEAA